MGRHHGAETEGTSSWGRAKIYAGVSICVISYFLGLTMGGFWSSDADETSPAPVTVVTVTAPAPPPITVPETTTSKKRSSDG